MATVSTVSLMTFARTVNSWPMGTVWGYLGEHYVTFLEYPPDAGTDEMRITDDANRHAAIVYLAGLGHNSETLAAAERALDAVRAGSHADGHGAVTADCVR